MYLPGITEGKAASLNMLDLHVCWTPVGEKLPSLFFLSSLARLPSVVMTTIYVYLVAKVTVCVFLLFVLLLWLLFVFTILL